MGAKALALAGIAGTAVALYYFRALLPGGFIGLILFISGFLAVWLSLRRR